MNQTTRAVRRLARCVPSDLAGRLLIVALRIVRRVSDFLPRGTHAPGSLRFGERPARPAE
jgi:hypothetical protein